MPRVEANGLELEYEERGAGEPLLLVMGIGAQLIHWPEGFVDLLVDHGFRVIRFDNRDIGLSTKLTAAGSPGVWWRAPLFAAGFATPAPYTLRHMADDAAALLDALAIDTAHVVGISMGGMIAQELALAHPERLRSLTSLMSSPGGLFLPKARAISGLLAGTAPTTVEEAIDADLAWFRTVGSPGYDFDEEGHRLLAARAFERNHCPDGFQRQLIAILGTPSRRRALASLRIPTLVAHGSADPLIPVAQGRATAAAIPGATWIEHEGWGHDLPRALWPELTSAIARHARALGSAAA